MDLITFLLLLSATLIVGLNLVALYWLIGLTIPIFAGGGPYVPTRPEIMNQMFALANITSHDCVVDLGSGDGRLVLASVEKGAKQAIGYEIHPLLVRLSRNKISQAGHQEKAVIFNRSMWKADLHNINVVLLYQIPYSMNRMKQLLEKELAPGSRIISHAFEIPGWIPDATYGKALLYIIKK